MQSDSDSENEFFDAPEKLSLSGSFSAEGGERKEGKTLLKDVIDGKKINEPVYQFVVEKDSDHRGTTAVLLAQEDDDYQDKTLEGSHICETTCGSFQTPDSQKQSNNDKLLLANSEHLEIRQSEGTVDTQTSSVPSILKGTEPSTENQGLRIDLDTGSSSHTVSSERISSNKADANKIIADVVESIETESAPPVAPPRRKKKKKLAEKATAETDTQTKMSSTSESPGPDSTATTPTNQEAVSTIDPFTNSLLHQAKNATQENPEQQGNEHLFADPSIHVDANNKEMKTVLEKASSTEIISALNLDSRLKSCSVSSLGSTRSDSYVSISSNISNGVAEKAGSFTSVASTHSVTYQTHAPLLRYRSASGRPLSDIEILEQVMVKNLDTGEAVPLSVAEEKLPKCTNPLALHIMRLTSEYSSNPDLANPDQEDGIERKVAKKTKKLKKFFKRGNKIKSDVKVRKEDSSSSDEETPQDSPTSLIKIKSGHGKGPAEFEKLHILQDLSGEHVGAVWTIKFTLCGRLMATAGQDHMVRVWVLKESRCYFEEMRAKYSKSEDKSAANHEASSKTIEEGDEIRTPTEEGAVDSGEGKGEQPETEETPAEAAAVEEDLGPFMKTPLCTYFGHTGDVLDLSWSKNYFLLSSSMDKTVRLWHISRTECLCCFQHIDFVTAICFHPRDDRYFLSGSLDGKIRLWNIPDKKVALWNEVEGTGSNLITAANFCLNGKFAVVGTYDGRCIFYETERLKYHTQWQVRAIRNKKARGRKISGIEPMPGEDKVLITSNDSRIRLYDLKDNSLYCKYKGCVNTSSQIKAGFSHDGQYVVCGSEDHFVYIWRTQHGVPSSRKDKNEFYESFSAHSAVVTAAMFAPVPWLIIPPDSTYQPITTEVLVTAEWSGAIKLFVNR